MRHEEGNPRERKRRRDRDTESFLRASKLWARTKGGGGGVGGPGVRVKPWEWVTGRWRMR